MKKLILFAAVAAGPAFANPTTGPVVETCAFLPWYDPCHFPSPPPQEQCFDERGVPAVCAPL